MQATFLNDTTISYSGAADLTPEVIALASRILEIKSRIGIDLSKLCYAMYKIKSHLKDDYVVFCKDVFGFNESQIYKYPRIGESLSRIPRKEDDSLDLKIIEQFSNEALLALSKADDEVFEGAVKIADDGGRVTASVAQDLLSARNALMDRENDLKREQKNTENLRSDLQSRQQEIESMQRMFHNTKARLEDSEKEVSDLRQRQRDMLTNLQKTPLVAVTETSPDRKGAESLLDGLNAEIGRATSRRDRVLSEVQKLERELTDVGGRIATFKQASAGLDDLKSDIDAILSKYTDVLLIQIRGVIPQSQAILDEYAEKLRDLANHISH